VLFFCGLNSIRSPMAEVLARQMLPRSIFVASAGVRTGPRDPFVDAVLAEKGLSLDDWRPRRLEELEDSYFELIVTLAPEAHHAALELTRTMAIDVEYWPTLDPSAIEGTREQIMAAYRDVRDGLAAQIARRLAPGPSSDER
jgi:protein-tyrosine-phosphatase